MSYKYDAQTYEEVCSVNGWECDGSHDDEIDLMPRHRMFNDVCTYNGLISYGYLLRKWLNDIFNVDLDAEVGEAAYSVKTPKSGKYCDEVYQFVRQRLDYDEFDGSHDDEIDEMTPVEVFDEVIAWEGIIGYSEEIMEWVECVYDVDLWKIAGEERSGW